MSKHSPAPWGLSRDGGQLRINSESGSGYCVLSIPICEAYGDVAEDEANANLIAAAPDMLGALKDVVDSFGINPFMTARREISADDLNRLIKVAIVAIAKAEGRE